MGNRSCCVRRPAMILPSNLGLTDCEASAVACAGGSLTESLKTCKQCDLEKSRASAACRDTQQQPAALGRRARLGPGLLALGCSRTQRHQTTAGSQLPALLRCFAPPQGRAQHQKLRLQRQAADFPA